MTRNNDAKRREWHDYGAGAYQRVFPKRESWYVCPLCKRAFAPQVLDSRSPLLTIEHAPPEKLGGRPIALTCRNCNSGFGHTLEAEMERWEDALDFRYGATRERKRGRAHFETLTANVEYQKVGDETFVEVPDQKAGKKKRINRPGIEKDLDALIAQVTRDGKPVSFRLCSQFTVQPRPATVGWLRAAFLVAFAKLGYSYAFHEVPTPVLEQIENPASEWLRVFSATDPSLPRDGRAFVILEEPFAALMAQMGRHTVFLPWSIDRDELYDRLAREAAQQGRRHGFITSFKGKQFQWPNAPEFALDFRQPFR